MPSPLKSFKSSLDLCKCISVSIYMTHNSMASIYWQWTNHQSGICCMACTNPAVVQLALFTCMPILSFLFCFLKIKIFYKTICHKISVHESCKNPYKRFGTVAILVRISQDSKIFLSWEVILPNLIRILQDSYDYCVTRPHFLGANSIYHNSICHVTPF